jgi:hypothetical protein
MLDPCPGRDVASLPGPIYLVPVERLLKHLTLSRRTLHHIRRIVMIAIWLAVVWLLFFPGLAVVLAPCGAGTRIS